jgi:hypothetical protein
LKQAAAASPIHKVHDVKVPFTEFLLRSTVSRVLDF